MRLARNHPSNPITARETKATYAREHGKRVEKPSRDLREGDIGIPARPGESDPDVVGVFNKGVCEGLVMAR